MPCSNCVNFTPKEKDCGFCAYLNFHVNERGICEQFQEAFEAEEED